MGDQSPVRVSVTREYEAPPERVFDAWLDPDMIGRWMFGPGVREEEIIRLRLDARVGGSFSFVVRRQGQEIDHVGEYIEIARPRRLVFTWGIAGLDSSRVMIDIASSGAGCELKLTHELHPDWGEYAERTEAGWRRMLTELARALA